LQKWRGDGGGSANVRAVSKAVAASSRSVPLKVFTKLIVLFALVAILGCGSKDLNKSLKAYDPSAGKPQLIKDVGKDEAKALK
jgi:hypothetical protein